ncbi:MAG: ABC transporter permease [Puniceicoccales bacterium]|jgi:ABC-2 type transport system permease protein|nr:ABC transporter permease [Puniceicoccales bacterium]
MFVARLLALIKKEFLSIWRDPKSRAIVIVPPILQFLIFANALTMEIKNVDLMVLDRSNSCESREFIAGFEGSRWFGKIHRANTLDEIATDVERQKIGAAIIIDSDFARHIKSGKSPNVQMILDGRSPLTATSMNGYASQIAAAFSKKLNQRQGIDGARICIEVRNWFNPNATYKWYLLTSLVVILSLVVTLILTALSVARERELGTFEQLIVSPYTSSEILLGKTIPPLALSLAILSAMTLMVIFIFGIPFTGSFPLLIFSAFVALLSFVGVGLFISSISKNQQQAILGVFAFMMPAILLSGFLSPIEDMPKVLQHLTYLNPIRFFMNISRGLFLKKMPFADVFANLIPLGAVAAITLTMAARSFKRNLE